MLQPELPQCLCHGVPGVGVVRLLRCVLQRGLTHQTGDALVLLRLFHGGEIGRRDLKGQPAKAILIVLHPCVGTAAVHRQRLARGHMGCIVLCYQKALHIAGGDAVVTEHQGRRRGVVDIVTGLGAVQKRQGEIAAGNGKNILLIGDVGGQIEQDVLLGPPVIEVYLPLVSFNPLEGEITEENCRTLSWDVNQNKGTCITSMKNPLSLKVPSDTTFLVGLADILRHIFSKIIRQIMVNKNL